MVEVSYLQNKVQQRHFKGGQRIAPQNQNKEFYIVVSGQVDIFEVTSERTLQKVKSALPGTSFGQRSFFGDEQQLIFAAATNTTVFVVTEENFERIAKTQPQILFGLLKEAYAPETAAPKPQMEEPVLQQPPAPESCAVSVSSDLFPVHHKGYPGVTHPEYRDMVIEKTYACPHCGRNFNGYKILQSKLSPVGSMRYDLRRFYKNFDPAWYEILTCPHCYFSMFADYFNQPLKLSKIKITTELCKIPQFYLLDFDSERDLDFVFAVHYIALICAKGYSNEQQLAMKLWSNLSWLYEDQKDAEMEQCAAKKSAACSEAAYMENAHLNPVQEQLLCLSTAGMLHRAGEEENVMKWLFNAKTNRQGKRAYADLAEDLMDELKKQEESKKASH